MSALDSHLDVNRLVVEARVERQIRFRLGDAMGHVPSEEDSGQLFCTSRSWIAMIPAFPFAGIFALAGFISAE